MTQNHKRIDAHQHFWGYQTRDYGWISDDMPALKQDRLPEDLYPLLQARQFDGCIAVQARQTDEETDFLVDLAQQNPWIMGVVGWADLRSANVEANLRNGRASRLSKGIDILFRMNLIRLSIWQIKRLTTVWIRY